MRRRLAVVKTSGLRLNYDVTRWRGRRAALNSLPAECFAQFVFGAFENALALFREIFPGAVDVEVQHRHRRLIRFRFAAFAAFG